MEKTVAEKLAEIESYRIELANKIKNLLPEERIRVNVTFYRFDCDEEEHIDLVASAIASQWKLKLANSNLFGWYDSPDFYGETTVFFNHSDIKG